MKTLLEVAKREPLKKKRRGNKLSGHGIVGLEGEGEISEQSISHREKEGNMGGTGAEGTFCGPLWGKREGEKNCSRNKGEGGTHAERLGEDTLLD